MKKIRVFPAGEFICDNCGLNNFFSLVGSDVPDEVLESTKQELAKEIGVEHVSGCFLIQPKAVKCKHCESQFEIEF